MTIGHAIRRVRLGTGLVLFAFVTSHLANHSLGLLSLDAMERGREWFVLVWRSPVGTALLYLSLLTHLALAFWAIVARRSLRMGRWEWLQLGLGLAVPILLAGHIVGTRGAHELAGIEDSYTYELLVLWVWDPWKAALQVAGLVAAWVHGCIGLHYWLRLRAWYRPMTPALYALALLLPVFALLGFATAGREVATLAQNEAWLADAMARLNLTPETMSIDLEPLMFAIWAVVGGGLAASLLARKVRHWLSHRRDRVRLVYPGGRIVEVEPGLSVLEASREGGIPHASVCGGRGRCSTCRVRVGEGREGLLPPSADERHVLQRVGASPNVRLACQIRPPAGRIEVHPLLPATAGPRDAMSRPSYLAGTEKPIAVLFADLRGFTQFSEQKLPYDVVFVLNRYFHAMGLAVRDAGGHLDKFIGDGVMALFGVKGGIEEGSRAALDAAGHMARRLDELNQSLADELPQPLRIGIGIHTGSAIIGEMGFDRTISLTAVGDTVNIASRLEALTKEFDAQVVFSDAVADAAGLRPVGVGVARHEVMVRGRRDPIGVWAIPDAAKLETEPAHAPETADDAGPMPEDTPAD